MFQHSCCTRMKTTPVEVLMGWDRQRQGFSMAVLDRSVLDGTEKTIYWSGYADDHGHPHSHETLSAKLYELGICVPKTMWTDLAESQVRNVGYAKCKEYSWQLADVVIELLAELDVIGFADPDSDVNGEDCVDVISQYLGTLRAVVAFSPDLTGDDSASSCERCYHGNGEGGCTIPGHCPDA